MTYRFGSLVDDFLNNLRTAKRAENTIDGYRRDLYGVGGRIVDAPHLSADSEALQRRVAQIDVRELDTTVMRRGFGSWARDHTATSQARAWTVWNQFFKHLIGDGVLERNPMSGLLRPKLPKSAPRSIKHPGADRLMLDAAATLNPKAHKGKSWPERDLALVATFSVTAIRLEEAITASLQSVTGPPGARRLEITGKGKKDRSIPIEGSLETLIGRYLISRRNRHGPRALEDPHSPLFVHYDGTPLTRGRLQYVIGQIYKRAGVNPPRGAQTHALRHTFATLAVENGIDIVELRELLGHASLATTSRYVDATGNRLRQAVKAHPTQRVLGAYSER